MPDNQEIKQEAPKQADLNTIIADMQKKIEELTLKLTTPKLDDSSDPLLDKVKKDKEEKENAEKKQKEIEDSVAFNLLGDLFLKENGNLLPPDSSKIFEAANKEKYDSTQSKTNAIKSSLVQSFFKLQDNMDLLTAAQKESVESFLKLTKTAKESEAANIYSNIMEPTLLMLKKIKKAEELAKSKIGYTDGDDFEKQYTKKCWKIAITFI